MESHISQIAGICHFTVVHVRSKMPWQKRTASAAGFHVKVLIFAEQFKICITALHCEWKARKEVVHSLMAI